MFFHTETYSFFLHFSFIISFFHQSLCNFIPYIPHFQLKKTPTLFFLSSFSPVFLIYLAFPFFPHSLFLLFKLLLTFSSLNNQKITTKRKKKRGEDSSLTEKKPAVDHLNLIFFLLLLFTNFFILFFSSSASLFLHSFDYFSLLPFLFFSFFFLLLFLSSILSVRISFVSSFPTLIFF
ncbi:unnamed protein product [Acanthosepion pharaonis]|uniref:Uncharacterized protein n=1 Tax=Acanthosepion pharaonis TaxID=158019 RepID=A0A812CK90_ACAPH|nr:unnamed protein product [Sepia pharaonis]